MTLGSHHSSWRPVVNQMLRPTLGYLARRLLFAVLLVLLVSSGAFLLTHLAPGDATAELVRPGVSAETRAAARARLGLDRPFLAQYVDWIGRAARFDLGQSYRYGRPVTELVGVRARNTALLAMAALALATVLGVGLGIVAGSRRSGVIRAAIGGASMAALSVPSLLASLGLAALAARTGWFPIGGMTSIGAADLGWVARAVDTLWHLTLPAIALGLPIAAGIERLQSQALAATLEEPFVHAAVARGIPWRRVVWRHALPVAIRPVAGVYGVIIASLLSGSFVVEVVSAWPGLGQMTYEALIARDVNLVAGCAAAGSVFLVVGNLLSDAAVMLSDPRLRDA